jgi:hypothetical protein
VLTVLDRVARPRGARVAVGLVAVGWAALVAAAWLTGGAEGPLGRVL